MNDNRERVLLADIGGTHLRFALADPAATSPLLDETIRQQPIATQASLEQAARDYLRTNGAEVRRGVFAIAGPVSGDMVKMTNHCWSVSRPQLCENLGLDALDLVNDFAAQAEALQLLRDDDLITIGSARSPAVSRTNVQSRTCVILGPGTGFGVAAWLERADQGIALATEAGHIGFAPGTAEEVEILQRLAARHGRVSVERLLSGPGLVALHRAMAEIAGEHDSQRDGEAVISDPAKISEGADTGDPRCARTVEMFCQLLGVVAGDLVLAFGAWEGAYLTGGMLPHLLPALQRSGFRRRFQDKGRYSDAIAQVATLAVTHPQPGLLGAAAIARRGAVTQSTRRRE